MQQNEIKLRKIPIYHQIKVIIECKKTKIENLLKLHFYMQSLHKD